MESNSLYTALIKHVFLIPAVIIITFGINGFLAGESIIVNGEEKFLDFFDLLIVFAIGLTFVILWLLIKDRVVNVKLGGQNITIFENGETEIINWMEVQSLKQLIFIEPPLYKLRIKNQSGYYLFVTQPIFLNFGFGIIDGSEMGAFIKKKKRELRI